MIFYLQGKLIYLNYGRYEDFKDALSKGKNLQGPIAVIRIGGDITVKDKAWDYFYFVPFYHKYKMMYNQILIF